MKTITINASKSYDIVIGEGILSEAGSLIRKTAGGRMAAVITDDIVSELYGKQLSDTLIQNGYRVVRYVFPHGESSKNAETFLSVLNFLAENKCGRTDVAIALGGGVAGDIAGFAASCYMRGINVVQIPATLLAMVDSSVGGKTAINLAAGKNLAGSFYQPNLVICDYLLLASLSPEVYRDGCAEIIKYGALADRALFESLKTPIYKQYENIIARCVEIKRDIVTEDEYEGGARKLLNFGHTVGHAIELLSGYAVSHGHAVAAGMAVVARAAARMGICEPRCPREIIQMLRLYKLPINTIYKADELARACLSDKKRDGESITMIFPAETGRCVLKDVPVGELESVIRLGLEEI